MLTKKHFIAIADIINSNRKILSDRGTPERGMAIEIARDLAHYFAQENPNFDRVRFLDACGVYN